MERATGWTAECRMAPERPTESSEQPAESGAESAEASEYTRAASEANTRGSATTDDNNNDDDYQEDDKSNNISDITAGDNSTDGSAELEQQSVRLYRRAKDENELLEFENYELTFKIQELEQKQREILAKMVAKRAAPGSADRAQLGALAERHDELRASRQVSYKQIWTWMLVRPLVPAVLFGQLLGGSSGRLDEWLAG